jgi:hypothetical protein
MGMWSGLRLLRTPFPLKTETILKDTPLSNRLSKLEATTAEKGSVRFYSKIFQRHTLG